MRPPPRPRKTSRAEASGPGSSGTGKSGVERSGSRPATGATPRAAARPSTAGGGRSATATATRTAAAARPTDARKTDARKTDERKTGERQTGAASASGRASARTTELAVGPATEERPARVSTAMADRLAERSAMRRHRTWRRVVAWVLVLAVLAGLAVGAFWSPVLALERDDVVVTGEGRTVDPDAVREVVEAAAGTPLPRLDTVALREQILDLHGVKDVSLARAWPHGLRVTLTARVPVAAVPDDGGYVVLDSEGVRLGTRPSAPSGLAEVAVPLDDVLALQAALHVLAALPPRVERSVEQVGARTQDAVETVLDDGTTVRWGSSEQMALKVEAMRTVRKLDPDATTIDVSSPELPVSR
ncbi:cell division protein FtsQ/DivIB [Isoptericola cucumis]|uniref:Cell division protein FtsQ n=1 Tax=Isoptericola cucumis TaxID=1776856 RepID=A0ABQ2B565_9MICO|nr:FtsQ-type POTRA domain-containing protein [Isoptericola cucumis]GGI07937.1 hypothetical protein GCM10007368_18670 [Isoptericola cucumis]